MPAGSASIRRRKPCSIRAGTACAPDQPEPARQLRRAQPARQLQQGQRVARSSRPRSGPGPAHRAGTGPPNPAAPGRAGPAGPAPPAPPAPRTLPRLARGEDQPDRLGQQPPRRERQHLRRRPVQPLRVIDHAQQRPVLRHLRQQRQHRQPDQKPVRRSPPPAARTRPPARHAAALADPPAGPAAARTADASWRTPAPSPIPPPPARATRIPAAAPATYSSSADLPTPASPRTTSDPPAPGPQIPQQAIERRALRLAVQQRRHRLRSHPHAHLRPQLPAPAPGAAKPAGLRRSPDAGVQAPGQGTANSTATAISSQLTGQQTCQEGKRPQFMPRPSGMPLSHAHGFPGSGAYRPVRNYRSFIRTDRVRVARRTS